MAKEATRKETVLYAAPGAGLGHLVRGAAVCLALRELGVHPVIISHSPYSPGLARLTGLEIVHIPARRWISTVQKITEDIRPRVAALDTFPWGLRGEWSNLQVNDTRFVYMARRLKVEEYLFAAGLTWENDSPNIRRVILTEPVNDDLYRLISNNGAEIHGLPGRIRFSFSMVDTHIPNGLEELLQTNKVWLIVHSGPEHEVKILMDLAQKDIGKAGSGLTAAILPRPVEGIGPVFEYFPAATLYSRAHRVVTAGGYNSVSEAAAVPEKHIFTHFPRRYDDQEGRLETLHYGIENGASHAAEIIAGWL